MDLIGETVEKLEPCQKWRKVLDSGDWQEKSDSSVQERYTILNATSKCIHGECDGSGLSIIFDNETKRTVGKYCRCREEIQGKKNLEFANIPKEFRGLTVKSFNLELYSENGKKSGGIAKTSAVNFVKNYSEFKEIGKGLYFFSPVKGSGKTRLAVSIGNALIATKVSRVKFIRTVDLLSEIKKSWSKNSKYTQSEVVHEIIKVGCLILDDIGVERESSWVNEILYSIIDQRMTKKMVTIFTSNVAIKDLKHDERIKSRIERMAVPIRLPDESVRSRLSKEENEKMSQILFTGLS